MSERAKVDCRICHSFRHKPLRLEDLKEEYCDLYDERDELYLRITKITDTMCGLEKRIDKLR